MTFYTPDMRDYQQLDEPHTGDVDCSGWCGAILVDAHTEGRTKTTGRAIRLNSGEVPPDPASPGLNLPQVDTAVLRITNYRINLDTKVQSEALDRFEVKRRIIDGRWATVQVDRGILVSRGLLKGFTGDHAITTHTLPGQPDVPILGDPLVPYYVRGSWDALFDAAEDFTRPYRPGKVYAQFTRDLTPDFRVRIAPPTGKKAVVYIQFILNANGEIIRRKQRLTGGVNRPCTPPTWHGSKIAGVPGRRLVQFTTIHGTTRWVDARYAHEVYP